MFRKDEKSDMSLYIVGWCILAVLFLLGIFLHITEMDLSQLLGPCALHALTGLYCPGCGGTRALRALFDGEFVRAVVYHPFVPFAAVCGTWFMISQTVERISGGRIRIAMHFREIYMWVALGIIGANFLVKNLALIIWHVDLLAG